MKTLAERFAVSTSLAFALLVLITATGCRLCENCGDLDYPAYGGAWQRTQRADGRVASVFDPGGGRIPELVQRDSPPDPDELERLRQERGDYYDDRQFDPDTTTPPESDDDVRERSDQLRDRQLDDIEEDEREQRMRRRRLDDIDI